MTKKDSLVIPSQEDLHFFGVGVITLDTKLNVEMSDSQEEEFKVQVVNTKAFKEGKLKFKHDYFCGWQEGSLLKKGKCIAGSILDRLNKRNLVNACYYNFLLYAIKTKAEKKSNEAPKINGKTLFDYGGNVGFIAMDPKSHSVLDHLHVLLEKQKLQNKGGISFLFEWVCLFKNDNLKTWKEFKNLKQKQKGVVGSSLQEKQRKFMLDHFPRVAGKTLGKRKYLESFFENFSVDKAKIRRGTAEYEDQYYLFRDKQRLDKIEENKRNTYGPVSAEEEHEDYGIPLVRFVVRKDLAEQFMSDVDSVKAACVKKSMEAARKKNRRTFKTTLEAQGSLQYLYFDTKKNIEEKYLRDYFKREGIDNPKIQAAIEEQNKRRLEDEFCIFKNKSFFDVQDKLEEEQVILAIPKVLVPQLTNWLSSKDSRWAPKNHKNNEMEPLDRKDLVKSSVSDACSSSSSDLTAL